MATKMIRSRRALEDCELAFTKFSAQPVASEFRLILVNCFALLRAIGHVAKNEAEENGILFESQKIWNQILCQIRMRVVKIVLMQKLELSMINDIRFPDILIKERFVIL